ncbi:5'-deoxynucleotidase HDDC2 isoform X2 [Planococcus citri]|uniref:5'-deoxynucleotidase HDDC2 isoform X2 n=1 Tax=Planococcus citri TaxID=170843 RepID=UPI0031F94F5F
MLSIISKFLRHRWPLLSSKTDNVKKAITMERSNSDDSSSTSSLPQRNLEFLELIGRLKHLKRTGWVLRKVQDPEAVAGHMYRMAVMSFLIESDSNIDRKKCMELAIVHDMAECIVGDITPICGISPAEKRRQEEAAMGQLVKLIGNNSEYVNNLFQEYEQQETTEAKLVKEFDRLDMIIQAFEYEKLEGKQSAGRLEEFFVSTEGKFSTPFVKAIVEELKKQRAALS